MSRSKQTPAAAEQSRMGAFSPRSMIDMLFSAAGPGLPRVDLVRIVDGGSEYIAHAAGNAAKLAEGMGCLVAHDGSAPAGVGSFQDGQAVAELLWHMQAHWLAVEGVASAVGWAANELAERGGR